MKAALHRAALRDGEAVQKTCLEQYAELLHLSGRLKPRSTSHLLTITLCMIALLVAQTFGGLPSFICDCSGTPTPTPASYCDGPHDAECHSDPAKKREGAGDRKNHEMVSHEVQARPLESSPQFVAPQIITAILPAIH